MQRRRYWWLPYVVLEFDKNEILIDALGGDLANPVWNYRANLWVLSLLFRLSSFGFPSLFTFSLAFCVMVTHVGFARVARVRSDLEGGFLLSSRRLSSFLSSMKWVTRCIHEGAADDLDPKPSAPKTIAFSEWVRGLSAR